MGNEQRFDFWSGIPCLTPRIARVSQYLHPHQHSVPLTIEHCQDCFMHNSRTVHDSSCASDRNPCLAPSFFHSPVPSTMKASEWARMAKDIIDNYDTFDAFVVLHGTDTMAFTASALSFMLENLNKTVFFFLTVTSPF